MIVVRCVDDEEPVRWFGDDATRLSTDEHNNLVIWGGHDGDQLLYVCAQSRWIDATISPDIEEE